MSEMQPEAIIGDGDPALGVEPSLDLETPEADALEQAQVVGSEDDEDYR